MYLFRHLDDYSPNNPAHRTHTQGHVLSALPFLLLKDTCCPRSRSCCSCSCPLRWCHTRRLSRHDTHDAIRHAMLHVEPDPTRRTHTHTHTPGLPHAANCRAQSAAEPHTAPTVAHLFHPATQSASFYRETGFAIFAGLRWRELFL